MKRPVHINVVGRKKSGKTGLIQALTRELAALGIRVGTVKHTSHDHEYDTPGTDSWKHHQAGSQATVILSPAKWVCHSHRPPESQLARWMDMIFQDANIILWEGDSGTRNQIIECVPKGEAPLFGEDERLIAIVSDSEVPDKPQRFKFNEVKRLCQWIIDSYSLGSDAGGL